jgi:hypothetical protein
MKTPENWPPALPVLLGYAARKSSVSEDEGGEADAPPASAASCAGADQWVAERPARNFRKMDRILILHWGPRGGRATSGRVRRKPG